MSIPLPAGIDEPWLTTLIEAAKSEDLGGGDVTSELLICPDRLGRANLRLKAEGVVCGLPFVEPIASAYCGKLRFEPTKPIFEGQFIADAPMELGRLIGPLCSILACERVLLNFLQRLGGVATLTHRYVDRVRGTVAKVFDTRKTVPGWRALDKYAVRCGGGQNHRVGLYDAVLIKDNHLAALSEASIPNKIRECIADARRRNPPPKFVEVESDRLEQLSVLLDVEGIDIHLLDNMSCDELREAVRMRDGKGSSAKLEASGNIALETVAEAAATGVDIISVGALTHSAPSLDISLDLC